MFHGKNVVSYNDNLCGDSAIERISNRKTDVESLIIERKSYRKPDIESPIIERKSYRKTDIESLTIESFILKNRYGESDN